MIAESELRPDLRAKAGASDLVQDAFLSAQGGFAQFRGQTEGELQGWLRTILINNLANHRRQYLDTEKWRIDRERTLNPEDAPVNGHMSSGPVDELIKGEESRALAHALERLLKTDRQVIQWRQFEKRSFEEIGNLLGKSSEAARKIWARAVKRLQQEMNVADGPS
jgi:RNA polymerase sigma-70 factor (ECF subfamily)